MQSHSSEQAAIAKQLSQELRTYDEKLRELLHRRWDPELYRELSDQFDHMQMEAHLLPALASRWTDLLISRVDLTHALWTLSAPSRINGRVVAYHAQHRVLIEEVRSKCQEYIDRAPPPRA